LHNDDPFEIIKKDLMGRWGSNETQNIVFKPFARVGRCSK
jgi:hypothetical protein